MRKYLFFLLGLLAFLNSNAITVYFENTVNWKKVCIYTHTPKEQTGSWSGTAMTVKEGNLWVYQNNDPKTSTKVIFNNGNGGSGNQYPTGEGFELVDGAVYDKTGKIADSYEAWKNGEVKKIEPWTIYLDASWNQAYAYLYKDKNGQYTSWADSPAMKKNSDGLWALTINDYTIDNTLVIFKDFTENGSNRNPEDLAVGITVKDGAVYNTSNRTYFDSVDAWKASQGETPDPAEPDYTSWYVNIGSDNWKTNNDNYYKGVQLNKDGIATFENLHLGNANFAIKIWDGADKFYYLSELAMDTPTVCTYNGADWVASKVSGASAEDCFTVVYDAKTNTITVTKSAKHEYTYSLRGNFDGNWKDIDLAEEDGKLVAKNVVVTADNAEFGIKVFDVNCNKQSVWYSANKDSRNVELDKELLLTSSDNENYLIGKGTYNLVVDLNSYKMVISNAGEVTPEPVEPDYSEYRVRVKAEGTDWGENVTWQWWPKQAGATPNENNECNFYNVPLKSNGGFNIDIYNGEKWWGYCVKEAVVFGKTLALDSEMDHTVAKLKDKVVNMVINVKDMTIVIYDVTPAVEKEIGFAYYHEDGRDHHRMYSIAGDVQEGEVITVTHAAEFGKDEDHYNKITATIEPAGELAFSNLNKGAEVESFKAGANEGESELVLKAHTAGIYSLIIKNEDAIEGDGVKFTPSEVKIPVRVSPSIRGIGLGFNWKGYQITNNYELAIVTDGLETWVEKDKLGNILHEWDLNHVHLTAFEANPEGLEIWYKYDESSVAADTEENAPVAYIGENEPSALDVATEQNTHPSEMGYTQFTKYGNAPSLNKAKENGGLSFVIVQNNIIGQPEHVTLRAKADDINSDLTKVDAIEAAEDAEAVYYTLDGIRVANPEKGLYIVVKGGKASKIIL